jgi:hypothetical protein
MTVNWLQTWRTSRMAATFLLDAALMHLTASRHEVRRVPCWHSVCSAGRRRRGEIGPVLGFRDQRFTGLDDINLPT